QLDDISAIAVTGVRGREIWVELNPDLMKKCGLSPERLSAALSVYGTNIRGGTVDLGRQEYFIRTITEFGDISEINKVIVRQSPGGKHLKLNDVARINDTWEKESTRSRLNGKSAVTLNISKKSRGNSIRLIKDIRAIGDKFAEELPKGVELVYTNDNSVYIENILHKLQNNAWIGMIFVVIVLYIFLGFRNALFTALGIPVSFMAAFIFMYYTGNTLNGSTLFALVLVLGIIVDDAIIVVENCFRYMLNGYSRVDAAIKGTMEVVPPVITATLTTIAVFLPLMLLEGTMGKFMRIVPIVVTMAIAASLVEAFLILPSHIAEWSPRNPHETGLKGWIKPLRKFYGKIIRKVLRRRYIFVGGVLIIALSSLALIPLVGIELYRDEEISEFYVLVRMPIGTNLDETDNVLKIIEQRAMTLPEEEVRAVIGSAGLLMSEDQWIFSPHVGQVIVDLSERQHRKRPLNEIINNVRDLCSDISGPERIEITKTPTGPPTGKPVEVKIKGKFLDELDLIAEELKTFLKDQPGVFDLGDNLQRGKPLLNINVNPDKAALYHLNAAQAARHIHLAVEGEIATVFLDGDEEIDVRIKYLPDFIDSFNEIRRIEIPSPAGYYIPFANIADIDTGSGIAEINRYKRERAVTVYANIDKNKTTSVKVNTEIIKYFESNIKPRYPEYQLDFTGEFDEFKRAFEGLLKLFGVGIILIYIILGTQFKSFIQPFIILVTIPFALIGAMIGLVINGEPFSIITMFGFVALAGVVVNDAIVMVTFINNSRSAGMSPWRSIIRAGKLRIRPIILTSVTTICGVAPMALGVGGKSEVWAPMANIIAWGLAASTILTLLIIPAVYAIIVDDIGRARKKYLKGKTD
ncbi:MAG: efflux RND transporter permease subunit, partial [FCB group bacterium]|nr:efflux RND transporter permease subunit [FCB group bacterium]